MNKMDTKNFLAKIKISKQFFLLMASTQKQSDQFFSGFETASLFAFTVWFCKQTAFRLVVEQKKEKCCQIDLDGIFLQNIWQLKIVSNKLFCLRINNNSLDL